MAVALLFALLSIPTPEPAPSKGASARPFAWKLDERWKHQETLFSAARDAGCERLRDRINRGFEQGRQILDKVTRDPLKPDDPAFGQLEMTLFDLGSMVGACPDRLPEYIDLITTTRSRIKAQSRLWDVDSQDVRDRLYRMLYGGRAALEEVMLQAPLGSYPALIRGDNETSVTPSLSFREQTLHSGDILVSRGGAPTSAIIARGNDYPGNFSHVALLARRRKNRSTGHRRGAHREGRCDLHARRIHQGRETPGHGAQVARRSRADESRPHASSQGCHPGSE